MNANALFMLVGMLALPVVACLVAYAIGSLAPAYARRWSWWFQPDDDTIGWTENVHPAWREMGTSESSGGTKASRAFHGFMNSLPIRQA